MAHTPHASHAHRHAQGCGHTAIQHGDHVDYLHDGHLHRAEGNQVRECHLRADATNPARCGPGHSCVAHSSAHTHGAGCGHPAVPHDGHLDYLVDGHLHHPHAGHCDDHGHVQQVG